ncbi:DotG/IcmE/VirB10 family protein [Phaeobacter piscinae]|uniref:DotG/IcmE/VirB10 family protein n=1 Tax=Phaeobacter piscinae TaxID=1580596 RepID=UPI00058CFE3D|nr:DotG/IcmE/VirB10 family protein [Phaeobacter piscinae]UTS82805.1 hypothetical protein OL67_003915 [Phaeobacter piscinae]
MNIKLMLAAVVGIILSVGITGVVLVTSKDAKTNEYAAIDLPDVKVNEYAPNSNINPMTPVEEAEADRRATLHGENADLAREVAASDETKTAAFVATPVVENVLSLGQPGDALGGKLFGNLFTPEPVEEEIEVVLQEPEPEPEPEIELVEEPKVEEVVEAQPDPRRDLLVRGSKMMEQLQVAPMDYLPNPTVRMLDEHSFYIPAELLGLELDQFARTSVFDDSRAYLVADSTNTINLTDPVVVPPPSYTTDIYNGLNPDEHSPARPQHVVVEPGGTYARNGLPGLPRSDRQLSGTLIEFGEMRFASLSYGFNNKEPLGLPIIATMTDYDANGRPGPFDGATLRGEVQYSELNASIVFDTARLKTGEVYSIEAIAVAGRNGTTGVAERVNKHTLARYGSLFLAGLIEGIGEAYQFRLLNDAENSPVIVVDGSGNTIDASNSDEPTDGEILAGALRPVGQNLSNAAAQGFNRRPTISARAGMPFAVVFVETVTVEDIQR